MAMGPHAAGEAEVLGAREAKARPGHLIVSVVTPKGSTASREVEEVVAPGADGEFGVLPGHVAFLSVLKAGVLTIRAGAERKVFAVGPGFLQVGADRTTVLVEMALAAESIDAEAARADKASADQALKHDGGSVAQANLDWAQARLDAVKAVRG